MIGNPLVEIVEGDEVGSRLRLEKFLRENKIDEPVYVAEIRRSLEATGSFADGGGPSPRWKIVLVSKLEDPSNKAAGIDWRYG